MKKAFIALAVALFPAAASAWIAQNDLIVVSAGGDDFSVPYRGKSGARDFWCAAGDYVIRELRRPPGTKIYRTSSPPRRAGQGIRFSLSAEGAKKPGLLLIFGGPGISAGHAQGFCREFFLFDDDT
jgi:hypothetical protein